MFPMTKEQFTKKIAKRIRFLREKEGITQIQLASNAGKDQQSICRLEAGKINPSVYYLFEIAKGLNVEMEDFIKNL
jgi:putative transcriptional regulator